MYVVEDYQAYRHDPIPYMADHPVPLKDELLAYLERGRERTFVVLVGWLDQLAHGGSFDVGALAFRLANCVA